MLRKSGMILWLVGISLLLSSCHITQRDVETISSNTDTLRLYKAEDRIEYFVTAINPATGTTKQGTMLVRWDATINLIDPIDINESIGPVLKETTTLTFDDNPNAEPDATVIRYISQIQDGPTKGSIILHAIDDGTGTPTNPAYWPYDPIDALISNSSEPVLSPVIFDSPIAVGAPLNTSLDFSMMESCGSGTCGSEIYNFKDNITVDNNNSEITTNLGRLTNLFKISFSGSNTQKNGFTRLVLGDIRHACGDSTKNLSHIGSMLVMPEIGIVEMTNLCQVSDDPSSNVNYSITISSTSITLP